MSSAEGTAAGDPVGTTATNPHDHHWFTEPTEPAKPIYVAWLLIAQLVFFIALLGPAIVGIGIKIQSLVHAGVIDANGATGAAGVLGGVGAIFATLANGVFGRVSDRTTSKWGRRRIWIVLGTVLMTAAFAIMALAPSLMMATVGWALAQLGANMTLAPFVATVADQVPKFQRGTITASLGIAQNVGILGGVYVAEWFANDLFIISSPRRSWPSARCSSSPSCCPTRCWPPSRRRPISATGSRPSGSARPSTPTTPWPGGRGS